MTNFNHTLIELGNLEFHRSRIRMGRVGVDLKKRGTILLLTSCRMHEYEFLFGPIQLCHRNRREK